MPKSKKETGKAGFDRLCLFFSGCCRLFGGKYPTPEKAWRSFLFQIVTDGFREKKFNKFEEVEGGEMLQEISIMDDL
jgi:hypothetical protein